MSKDDDGEDPTPQEFNSITRRQEENKLAEVKGWIDQELEDTIARKYRAGKVLSEVEIELERAKLEFYKEMIEASSGKKDALETAQLIEDIRKKEGRPIKPIEVPQFYWESDLERNDYLQRYYKSLNRIYREHDFQEMERQRQLRIDSRRKEREQRLLTQKSTQLLPIPHGEYSLPHRPIGDPGEESLPPIHHYHSNPMIPRLPDPQAAGRTYRPDPAPIGYIRNNLLRPHEKEAIEKEYWDVIEGRNDDWLYRHPFERVLVKIIPDRWIVPDAELKQTIHFQRYLYDRLALKHAYRLQGLNSIFMPVLRFWRLVITPMVVFGYMMFSPTMRELEQRHCFEGIYSWSNKFTRFHSESEREYRPVYPEIWPKND